MKSAPLHKNESARIQKLLEYEVLDTEAEKSFDDLTELASEICGTPISLISLVDPNRQWFKSKVGLGANETERDIAFCSHAILQDEVFEVEDATKDERFFDNPLVTSNPDIRFYAGMPLISPDGLPIGTLCVIDREPKKLDEHQRKALKILGSEVISKLELRVKTKRLEQANQFKTEFLSNMSHEIRTPLNAILGFTDLVLNNADEYLKTPIAKTYLENIDFSSKHLLSMINAVLDLSKIEAGKMELEPNQFDICDTLDNLLNMLNVKASQSNIKIVHSYTSDSNFDVYLDAGKFSQIIINLVNNAIKFSPSDSTIQLNLKIKNNQALIDVIDQGIGIAEEDLPTIFDKYHQVGQKSAGGTGLGLSITLGLVELMGGEISLKSSVNVGTHVSISIPLAPPPVASKSAEPSIEKPIPEGLRILVVEDNMINQVLVKAMLENLNCVVTLTDLGKESAELYKNHEFDLVLMDINLPDINGFEATELIKAHDPDSIVVALTADVFSHENEKLFKHKLTKPITLDGLKQTLSGLFG